MKKRIVTGVLAALMLLTVMLTLSSCGNQSEDYEICETLIYSGMPPISELIMSISAGKSEDDEKGESNDEALATTGTNYLVCMCYGTPDAYDLKENLRFVFVSGDDILYDEECVTVSKWKDYDIPNNPFHGVGKRSIEGIMVITFELNAGKDGKLYIDHEEDSQGRSVLLESPVGSIADGAEVSVDGIKAGYLTEETYRDGGFEDADMTDTPVVTPGAPSYMVLDLLMTARQKNEGDQTVSCHVGFPGLFEGGITVEAAPTTNIKMVERNGVLDVCTTYSIPQEKNGQKTVRMVLRMNDPEAVDDGIHLLLAGSSSLKMMGTVYMPDLASTSRSFEAFIPAWQRDTMPTWGKVLLVVGVVLVLFFVTAIIIGLGDATEWWEWTFPVLTWLAASAAMILMFCLAPFAWWVVLITTLVFYIALTLGHVLASNIVDNNVGSCGPLVFSYLISATGSILLFLLASWVWWASMLVSVGICAVSTLIFGAIGYRM